MNGRFLAMLLAGVAATLPTPVALSQAGEPESSSVQAPIYFYIEPKNTTPGMLPSVPDLSQPVRTLTGFPLRIHGATGRELFGKTLTVTVTPPRYYEPDAAPQQESTCPEPDARVVSSAPSKRLPPTVMSVKVSSAGRFEAAYTPQVDGEYEVLIQGAGQRGEKSFEASTPEADDECKDIPRDEVAKEVKVLRKTVCEAVDLVDARVRELPASPAKEELRKRIAELREALREPPGCDAPPIWVNGLDPIRDLHRAAPQTRKATAGLTRQFDSWLETVRQANADAPKALAQLTRGNVACDQLDIIVNGIKFIDFYLGLATKPGTWLLDWARENIPTKLVGMVPKVKQSSALKEAIETGWKGVTTFVQTKRPESGYGPREIVPVEEGFERAMGKYKMANTLVQYAVARVFEQYCQTFTGPVSGSMDVEIYENGKAWWTYKITIAGELVLRYPKNAKGDAIALTGEFIGNATSFKSWDNAVPVLFPKLAMGTVFRTMRFEPVSLDQWRILTPNKATEKGLPDPNPVTSTIEQGGLITRYVLTPAFYRVPVRGDLRGDKLRIELQPAALDFDDRRVKVVQILLPVLSLWPTVNDYALPYKGAHFILTRAMNDGPAEFVVQRKGDTLTIQREFKRERKTSENLGHYELKVKACNPSCN